MNCSAFPWRALASARGFGERIQGEVIVYEADLCEASFALAAGDKARCARALQRAFRVGARQDYLNHHHFFPDEMARLCAFALEHDIVADFARRLIGIRRLRPPRLNLPHWPWPVRIHTLGRFSLVVDGQPLGAAEHVQQKKPLKLLRVLIALGGREVGVADVIDQMWRAPEPLAETVLSPPVTATQVPARRRRRRQATTVMPETDTIGDKRRGAFESSLLRLRRLLGQDDAVLLEGGLLRLNADRCWLDLWHCQRLLGQLRATIDHRLGTSETDFLILAMDLLCHYPGDFLAREATLPCVARRRDDLRQQVVEALADLADILCRAGRYDEAAKLFERATTIEPKNLS